MKPIMQKFKHSETQKGDCLRACICSLLEITDEKVPNFVEDSNYPEKLYDFAQENNIIIRWSKEEPKNIEYYMAWGISPRGIKHSVIYKDGKLVHDPHPDGGGVTNIIEYVWIKRI